MFSYAHGVGVPVDAIDRVAVCGGDDALRCIEPPPVTDVRNGGAGGNANSARLATAGCVALHLMVVVDVVGGGVAEQMVC